MQGTKQQYEDSRSQKIWQTNKLHKPHRKPLTRKVELVTAKQVITIHHIIKGGV